MSAAAGSAKYGSRSGRRGLPRLARRGDGAKVVHRRTIIYAVETDGETEAHLLSQSTARTSVAGVIRSSRTTSLSRYLTS